MIKLIQLRSNVGLSLWTTVIAAASNACSLFDALNEYWYTSLLSLLFGFFGFIFGEISDYL